MKTQLKADLMLVLVTLCWGASYYLMDVALTDIDPLTLNAYRFLGAFLVAGVFAFRRLKNVNRQTLLYSLLIGTVLVFVYMGATFGVKYTTLSNSGFICGLTVIFVPIIEMVVFRKKPQRKIILAVTMSFIGIMLLALKDDFSINMENLKGDILCLVGALAYAVDLIMTEKAVAHEEVDAFQLGVFQLGVTGVCMLVLALLFEQPHLPFERRDSGQCCFSVCVLYGCCVYYPGCGTAVYHGCARGDHLYAGAGICRHRGFSDRRRGSDGQGLSRRCPDDLRLVYHRGEFRKETVEGREKPPGRGVKRARLYCPRPL